MRVKCASLCAVCISMWLALGTPALAAKGDGDLVFGVLHDNGDITDILFYTNGSWAPIDSRKAISFKTWQSISAAHAINRVSVVGLREGFETGDCNGVDWAIRTNARSHLNEKDVWVSNHREGYIWQFFENVALVLSWAEDARKDTAKEIPESLMPLAVQMKEKWRAQEASALSRWVSPRFYEQLRAEIGATQYFHFAISRASASSDVVLLYFNAEKIFHSPVISENALYDGENVFIDYEGWMAVYPDGRVSLLSSAVHPMASGENAVDDYRRIRPVALLEMGEQLGTYHGFRPPGLKPWHVPITPWEERCRLSSISPSPPCPLAQ